MNPSCWMVPKFIPLELQNVTLWSCVWSPDESFIDRTFRVLRYCAQLANFGQVIFFCCKDPRIEPGSGWTIIRIPMLTKEKWNVFVNREVPRHIRTDFAFSVHEDGFILHPSLWNDEFLHYDYIGAPWLDGVVGNQGFAVESKQLLQMKLRLPPDNGTTPSDNYLCRKHRKRLQNMGIRFAPTPLAETFSTEMYGDDLASFGFHGRTHSHRKYALGWQMIEQNE